MHQVLENIYNRRNKKVPLKDGRKIVMLLYGGVMSGMRGSGALIGLHQLGLAHAFDEIYCISAGFPNACYFLADDPVKGPSIYYEELSGKKFINKLHPWNFMDIDYLVDVFRNKKPLDVKKILAAKTKLYVGLQNVKSKKIEYKEVHEVGTRKFFDLMTAALSAPYLHPGSTKIGKGQYKDPLIWNIDDYQSYLDHVLETKATDILVIYNNHTQNMAPAIFSERVYEIIPPKDDPLSILETRPEILKKECDLMTEKVKQIFKP